MAVFLCHPILCIVRSDLHVWVAFSIFECLPWFWIYTLSHERSHVRRHHELQVFHVAVNPTSLLSLSIPIKGSSLLFGPCSINETEFPSKLNWQLPTDGFNQIKCEKNFWIDKGREESASDAIRLRKDSLSIKKKNK